MTTTETITYIREEIIAHRRQWLAELRSGRFKQTTGKLKSRNGSYCCLGVACVIAELPVRYVGGEYKFGDPTRSQSGSALPSQGQGWLGLISSDPTLDIPASYLPRDGAQLDYVTAASLNDDWRLSFAQIADMIEYFGVRGDPIGVWK